MEAATKALRAILVGMVRRVIRAIRATRGLKATLHLKLRRLYLHLVSRHLSNLHREVLEGPKVLQAVQASL